MLTIIWRTRYCNELYAIFWVIPRRLNFICQRFGTLCLFHLHRRVGMKHLPAYEDGTECSETSAYKIRTPGNYPEESIQHSEHGESLKSYKLSFGKVQKLLMSKQVVHVVYTVITLPYLQWSVNSEVGRMCSSRKRMSCKMLPGFCVEAFGKTAKALSQDKHGSSARVEPLAFAITKQKC